MKEVECKQYITSKSSPGLAYHFSVVYWPRVNGFVTLACKEKWMFSFKVKFKDKFIMFL